MSIKVTVGKIPGRAQEVTLDNVTTIAEALRVANISVDGQSELRVNNVKESNFNSELSNGDIISVVKNVKGNADIIQVAVGYQGETTNLLIEVGTYASVLMGLLGLEGDFEDYEFYLKDGTVLFPNYELKSSDRSIAISAKKDAEAKTEEAPVEAAPVEKKAPAKKKVVTKGAVDTIHVTFSVDGCEKASVLTLPRNTRFKAFFEATKLPGEFKDYEFNYDGKIITPKLAFLQLKDKSHISITTKTKAEDAPAEATPVEKKAPVKKNDVKNDEAVDTIIVTISVDGGETYSLSLPRNTRFKAFFEATKLPGEFKDYEFNYGGKIITPKLAFLQLKDGSHVDIKTCSTFTTPAEAAPVEKKSDKKRIVRKTKIELSAETEPVTKVEAVEPTTFVAENTESDACNCTDGECCCDTEGEPMTAEDSSSLHDRGKKLCDCDRNEYNNVHCNSEEDVNFSKDYHVVLAVLNSIRSNLPTAYGKDYHDLAQSYMNVVNTAVTYPDSRLARLVYEKQLEVADEIVDRTQYILKIAPSTPCDAINHMTSAISETIFARNSFKRWLEDKIAEESKKEVAVLSVATSQDAENK